MEFWLPTGFAILVVAVVIITVAIEWHRQR